jgi:hypothetical protein
MNISLGGGLGSTGTFGTPLYIADVDSGGDSGGRRNRKGTSPANDYEASSYGVGGGQEARSEGRALVPGHGERVRP